MATKNSPEAAARALRVGVILGERIVEERLFRLPTPISIGQSLRCTLSIPADGVPMDHTLFVADQGRLLLRVADKMTGRIAQGAAIKMLEGSAATIPVERGTRGKLHIGSATILFQEVSAPPLTPRPQLPASVRGSFGDRIDKRLAVIVGASLIAHIGLALYAWMIEPMRDAIENVDPLAQYETPQVIDMLPDITAPTPPAPTPGEPGPGVAPPAVPSRQTPRAIAQPRIATPEPIDADRWAQVMTGNTTGPDGQNEVKGRRPGVDLDKQIADIRDNNREVRIGTDPRTRPGDPTRRGTGPDGPDINDPRFAHNQPKQEKPPIVRITPFPRGPGPGPDLTPEAVVRRIVSSYMAGLQRCYVKHGLSVDPTMSAKVQLAFTVTEKGTTEDNTARGANGEVDACIRDQMALWRFPIPRDEDREATDAAFKVALVLQPSP